MIKKIVYLILPLVFSATSCGDLLKNGHEYFTVRNESDRKYSLTGVRTTKIPSSDQNILPQIELRGIIVIL